MPTVEIDGIATRYQTFGDGPPLLMFSPGGFNAVLENWRSLGIYKRTRFLDRLPERYTCITFDRRESGGSGGRLERIEWSNYVAQGRGLLDHLGIHRAHLMGGCVGCSIVLSFAVHSPERVGGMVLYSPAGGAKYRLAQHRRFVQHLAFVDEHGLDAVVSLARSHDKGFTADPRVGPWGTVLRSNDAFAERFSQQDLDRYRFLVAGTVRLLFDRDTVAGAEPEDLLRLDIPALVVSGEDDSHAPSAAHYLAECLPASTHWNVPLAEQTEQAAPARVAALLDAIGGEMG